MTEPPAEGNVGVNLSGHGDIDMWTGPTWDIAHAVAAVGRNLSSAVPDLFSKIEASHEAISSNITTWDEVSAKYMEQENAGLPEFTEAVNGFPERLVGDANSCFKSVDYYLANDGEMAQRMRDVSGSPSGPESRA